jgi:transcriptional regulator with GAF, ATPase, and Fis domain
MSTVLTSHDDEADRLEGLVNRLSSTLIQLPGKDVGGAFTESLREIGDILDADRVTLVELAPDPSAEEVVHSWARTGVPAFENWRDLPSLRSDLDRLEADQTAFVVTPPSDAPQDLEEAPPPLDALPRQSGVVMPITIGEHLTCVLSIDGFQRQREWPAPTLSALRFITEILAANAHRRRQEDALEQRSAAVISRRADDELESSTSADETDTTEGVDGIVADSPAFKAVLHRMREVAPTDATVLLVGETGTGKEIIARELHRASARRLRPLVRVNCGALPATLIESELFGHERGAFTGAVTARQGRFELADRGTIFLDEIGDLPQDLQAKLLRVLQEGEFERIGSSTTRRVDVRVIAATHRNLEEAVAGGSFREDLYYRICVFPINLPPLRERRSDIERLVWLFIAQRKGILHRNITEVPLPVLQALEQYDWPGNVRELENVIERAMIRSAGSALILEHDLGDRAAVPPAESTATPTGDATLEDVERRHVAEVLRACGWRINGAGNAAERLGLHPNTLRFRMKKLKISRPGAS